MDASKVAKTLLVRSIEETGAETIPGEALIDALVAAGEMDDEAEWLARRAEHLLGRLSPSYEGLLAMASGLSPSGALLVGIPLLLGLASNSLGPSQKIHAVYNPIAALMLWNGAIYLALMARPLLGRALRARIPVQVSRQAASGAARPVPATPTAARTRPSFRRRLLNRLVPDVWIRVHRVTADANANVQGFAKVARAFWSEWTQAARPLLAPALHRAFHLGAFGLAVGAIAGMFVRGLFLDYQVVWRSTFIHDPATVASLLGALLAPGAFALGEALPDADAVRPMMTGEGVAAAPWIAVYAASAAVVILAPRALLAAWEALRIRSRRSRLSLDLGSCYYQKVIGKAREVRVGQIQETIRADVRLGSARFAEGIATFVEARLFDEKIVPHLARFREEGGRIEDLEQAIARECRGFEPALGRHLDLSRAEFERSLTASVADSVGAGVALSIPAEGSLSDDVGAASRGSSASVGEAIGAGVQRTLGYSVTATLGLLVGTLSGGFGHHLGAAIVVALLGTTGPIGFLVGALVGIAVAGGAWYVGREKAAGAIKHLPLPGPVVRTLLSESRLERMLADARHTCHASVEGLIKQRLEGLLPEIAEQIWRKVKPALGEQQRVRASER